MTMRWPPRAHSNSNRPMNSRDRSRNLLSVTLHLTIVLAAGASTMPAADAQFPLQSPSSHDAQREFPHALIPDLLADPSIVEFDGMFYCYATTDGMGQGLSTSGLPVVWKSRDFLHWHFEGSIFPRSFDAKYWAPNAPVKRTAATTCSPLSMAGSRASSASRLKAVSRFGRQRNPHRIRMESLPHRSETPDRRRCFPGRRRTVLHGSVASNDREDEPRPHWLRRRSR